MKQFALLALLLSAGISTHAQDCWGGPPTNTDGSITIRPSPCPTPTPTPTPIPSPTPFPSPTPTPGVVFLEAEQAALTSPMVISSDVNANGGKYVSSEVSNSGTATFTANLPAGTYFIWARVIGVDSSHDSFFVRADGGVEDIYSVGGPWLPTWRWTKVNGATTGNPRTWVLSAGTHTFTFRAREPGTKLDQIAIVSVKALCVVAQVGQTTVIVKCGDVQ
jgi:hypothetical protein